MRKLDKKDKLSGLYILPLDSDWDFLLSLIDSCKFLHDRSDYKHGWQIERELDEGRYGVNGEFLSFVGRGCRWLASIYCPSLVALEKVVVSCLLCD